MTDALRKLIEAVEAGTFDAKPGGAKAPPFNKFMDASEDSLPQNVTGCNSLAWEAYNGDLNAAKSLHDSLLPGWEWEIGMSNAVVWLRNGKDGAPRSSGMSHIAARAWLLAILKAKLAESS